MKIQKTVDVDITFDDVTEWMCSGVSEYDLYAVLRVAALTLGKEGVAYLREKAPKASLTPDVVATMLATETLIGLLDDASRKGS
jgi:hypothetical protein